MGYTHNFLFAMIVLVMFINRIAQSWLGAFFYKVRP